MIRVGVIGGGFMGGVHTAAARAAGGEVVAITTSSRQSGRDAALRLSIPQQVDDLDALLALELDVVHVCSPNAMHAAHATTVIESGTSLICEKPLATSAIAAARLRDAAAAAGVVAVVPFVYRFHPMVREARTRVTGRVHTVQGSYLQDWLLDDTDDDWRVDGAAGGPSRAFADIGSHLVDLLEFVTRDRIVQVHALVRTVHPKRRGRPVTSEDAVALVVRTESGAIGSLLVSQVAAGHKNSLTIEISTAESTIRFDQEAPDAIWLGGRASSMILPRDRAHLSADAARLSMVPAGHPMGFLDAFTAMARDTYTAIQGEVPLGLPTFADGARAAEITEAVLRSASSGMPVTIPSGSIKPVPAPAVLTAAQTPPRPPGAPSPEDRPPR